MRVHEHHHSRRVPARWGSSVVWQDLRPPRQGQLPRLVPECEHRHVVLLVVVLGDRGVPNRPEIDDMGRPLLLQHVVRLGLACCEGMHIQLRVPVQREQHGHRPGDVWCQLRQALLRSRCCCMPRELREHLLLVQHDEERLVLLGLVLRQRGVPHRRGVERRLGAAVLLRRVRAVRGPLRGVDVQVPGRQDVRVQRHHVGGQPAACRRQPGLRHHVQGSRHAGVHQWHR
mmetsp:Transcript_92041/g.281696  ORF Transcript_92041/g.281696 Transcript_92041/m.281696 type:complete len:229 (-) Transcript_92041:331-1017(-)